MALDVRKPNIEFVMYYSTSVHSDTVDIREHMLYQDRLIVDDRFFRCKVLCRGNRLYRLAQLLL